MRLSSASLLLLLSIPAIGQQINPQQVKGTAVVQTPSGTQSVSGTLNITGSLNGTGTDSFTGTTNIKAGNTVLEATLFPGSDIGAKINAAAAALSPTNGGTVTVAANGSCQTYSTPIVVSSNLVNIVGRGPISTCIQFTASTGVALSMNCSLCSVKGMQIKGPNIASQSNTGVKITGNRVVFENVVIGDGANPPIASTGWFHLGMTFGDASYLESFYNVDFQYNYQNLYWPHTILDAGEALRFFGGTFADGQNNHGASCLQIGDRNFLAGAEMLFYGTSFDGCQIINNEGILKIYGSHFENVDGYAGLPFVETYSNAIEGNPNNQGTYLSDVTAFYGSTPASGVGVFSAVRYGNIQADKVVLHGNPPIPLFYMDGSTGGTPYLMFHDSSNNMAANQVYSIASGTTNYHVNVDTLAIHTQDGSGTSVFVNSGISFGQQPIMLQKDYGLNFYAWTGSGSTYSGRRFSIAGGGGSMQICTTPNFSWDGLYTSLGSETWTCGAGISTSDNLPQVNATPTLNRAACIKAVGPPVIVGYCSNTPDGSGACTCN